MAEAVTMPAPPPINRREVLAYAWMGTMALALAATGGAVLWFAYPRFREGEFGGVFTVPAGSLPGAEAGPAEYPDGRFWLVNSENGVYAFYKVCVHLGCLYKWVPSNNRFECPCHGSKYQRTGEWIEGPAPRNLDRFVIQAVDADGNVLAETQTGDANRDPAAGGPILIPSDVVDLKIDTGNRVKGANHP